VVPKEIHWRNVLSNVTRSNVGGFETQTSAGSSAATALPDVEIKRTERELAALANLAFAAEANRPTEALIRALKD